MAFDLTSLRAAIAAHGQVARVVWRKFYILNTNLINNSQSFWNVFDITGNYQAFNNFSLYFKVFT